MFLPSYTLNVVYEANPPPTRSIKATTATQTWTVTDLRCAVTVKADNTKNPNTSEIKLWNVSPTSLAKMSTLGDVSLTVGYQDETQGVIFRGNIMQCLTTSEADGQVTSLRCSDGGRAHALGNMQVSFKPNSTATQIANKLIDSVVAETGLGEGSVRALVTSMTPKVYRRGFSDSGSSLRILGDFLVGNGIELSIQNMALHAVLQNQPSKAVVYELSAQTGLIGSPDFTSSVDTLNSLDTSAATKAKAKMKKLKLQCLLLPLIQVNQQVHVTSKTKSGYFQVTSIEHKFDTHGNTPWTTTLEVM